MTVVVKVALRVVVKEAVRVLGVGVGGSNLNS